MQATAMGTSEFSPDSDDAKRARDLLESVSNSLKKQSNTPGKSGIGITVLHSNETIEVPRAFAMLFLEALRQVSQGNGVYIVPGHKELTTQEAADILNVSRPYVVKILDEGKIPFRLVGKHRRIRMIDLMTFKKADECEREKAYAELVALGQDMDAD